MRGNRRPLCSWFSVEWIRCIRCQGSGERVECYDDLCHAEGRCIHDPANNACNLCAGTGVITTELKEHWLDRDTFGSIIVPDADLWKQGKLHAVAREQYSGGVQVDG